MNYSRGKKIGAIILASILLICTLYLFVQLISLNVLPPKYLFLIISILFLIDSILILLFFFYIKKKMSEIFVIVICLVISFCAAFSGFYIQKMNTMFKNITDISGKSKNTVSLIVKESSDMYDLGDINSKNVGVLRTIGVEGSKSCIQSMKEKEIRFHQENFDSISNLLEAFYNSQVDAIILNESNRSIVLDMEPYQLFNENTRVIFQTGFEGIDSNKAQAVENITKHPFNILITGSDSRLDLTENARSDVNMIVTVNPLTNTILLTSIPRDYYVPTVCDAKDGCAQGSMDKITHTGMTGINTTKRTVEKLFGIEINYTFKVGFESVTSIVDAIGGIDVMVEPGNAVPVLLHAGGRGVVEGVNHMDGQLALAFARERYAYQEGDRQRTKNQQLVLMAIIDKVTSPSIISGYANLMDALGNTFITNMTQKEIQSLIQYQIEKRPTWKIEQYMVNGTGDTLMCAQLGQPAYVMIPDQKTVAIAKRKISAVKDGQSSTLITGLSE